MSEDFAALLEATRPPERTVWVCLRGDLQADHDELQVQLADANKEAVTSLGGGSVLREIAEKVHAVEEEMAAARRPFRFRALDPDAWVALGKAHPPREGTDEEEFNTDTYPAALVAACCVAPVMTAEQVKALFGKLSDGQREVLFSGAWSANKGRADVPFSVLASALTRGSGES
jgi:hypothetical protein